MEYIYGIIIGIIIYSLLLTVFTVYKDNSSYFIVHTSDVIMAGPVAWIFILLINVLIGPVYRMFHKEAKKRPSKRKNALYISKIVKKVVKNYSNKSYCGDYFDFNKMTSDGYGEYEGYLDLLVKKPKNERLNNKFSALMRNQKEETVAELMNYFTKVTESIMRKHDCNEWYIEQYKNKNLYVLNTKA